MLSSKGSWLLDGVIDDSELGDEGREELISVDGVFVRVTVSALERGAKRPWALGCVVQASAVKRRVI